GVGGQGPARRRSGRGAAAAYARYSAPAPGRVIREVSPAIPARRAAGSARLGNGQRAPLLVIAAGKDRLFPARLTRSRVSQYGQHGAVTGYREFPGRSHLIIGEPGWGQVPDHALRCAIDMAPI